MLCKQDRNVTIIYKYRIIKKNKGDIMSYLFEIKDFVQKLSIALANSLELQMSIIDENLIQVGGTGRYESSVCTKINSYGLMHKSMITKELYYVENPRENKLCYGCTMRQTTCRETASVGYPILMDNEAIGAIGINCFTLEERNRLITKKPFLVTFLKSMSELIAAKVKENISLQEIKQQNDNMTEILDCITDGMIIVNNDGTIKHINKIAENILEIGNKNTLGKPLSKILKNINIDNILSGKEDFIYSEYYSKKEKKNYGLFINAIKKDKKDNEITAVVLIKNIKDVNKVVSMNYIEKGTDFEEIVGSSTAISKVKEVAKQIATKSADVLIYGESGTGKELFARAIHSSGDRRKGPFVSINCAAIPQDLLESELFGYESGAFTGANKQGKIGKFELANGGTLFLDEIGDMPLYLQAKLLRVLENRVVEKVGGNKPIQLDIRIISATNKNLEEMIKTKEFREDLYYRLNVVPLKLPSLRERKEDIKELLLFFLDKYNKKYNASIRNIDENAWKTILNYDWPGNVRELENLVQYLCCVCESNEIEKDVLLKRIPEGNPIMAIDTSEITTLEMLEKEAIENAIGYYGKDTEGKLKAAAALGIGKSTLYRKLKEYSINL